VVRERDDGVLLHESLLSVGKVTRIFRLADDWGFQPWQEDPEHSTRIPVSTALTLLIPEQ
jgi:hypothetical protein